MTAQMAARRKALRKVGRNESALSPKSTMTSLNPLHTIENSCRNHWRCHQGLAGRQRGRDS